MNTINIIQQTNFLSSLSKECFSSRYFFPEDQALVHFDEDLDILPKNQNSLEDIISIKENHNKMDREKEEEGKTIIKLIPIDKNQNKETIEKVIPFIEINKEEKKIEKEEPILQTTIIIKKEEFENKIKEKKNKEKFSFDTFLQAFKSSFCRYLYELLNKKEKKSNLPKSNQLKKADHKKFCKCNYYSDYIHLSLKVKDIFISKQKNKESIKKFNRMNNFKEKFKEKINMEIFQELQEILELRIDSAICMFYESEKFFDFKKEQEKLYGKNKKFSERKNEIFKKNGYLELVNRKGNKDKKSKGGD